MVGEAYIEIAVLKDFKVIVSQDVIDPEGYQAAQIEGGPPPCPLLPETVLLSAFKDAVGMRKRGGIEIPADHRRIGRCLEVLTNQQGLFPVLPGHRPESIHKIQSEIPDQETAGTNVVGL